ncbi:hypothetical protein A3H10_04750 [Candidatus Uhrbacteria bacterium RIFCSPLOWO2_12_FULL_46_10]|uniref:ECF transporter S component n=1 Tax=Candidatus Uhrbacteria bacterium RIFCSPLOWO2_01_FULL_47_25 TaxID=1802402 RepID=A0A1F7UXK8_9BACT|nr:MAG: hypothetical protein A3D60_05025 [Candidatus Uhrbacteria bacterium RIFCSPHIGHO2_02_FULL_47_29]OGL75539.1 MAG: hypothetical protein A3E96_01555 [Candidatus Uhrbacteria bacterium RIFCSPHIGHO2_12_FULL_46_13]OGL82458.1 MAG: hypothetical protein A2936_02015 [Candidatus Uhrbacteria bacterium RIFCSPLOWO2_01_FULL_47_25]OGL90908.1 MAG: hypothetical protein A3H10_04750 [Candidatus Uhrbacteria bacterium RIFCSPLOWO2_12_FULL_46_10]
MTLLSDNQRSFNKKQILFSFVFIVLGLLFLQVPLTHLVGSKATFTLFDAFGPVAGGFLGAMPGALSVLLMQVFNFLVHGAHIQDAGTIIRLLPMMFAAAYFGRKTKLNIIIPAVAILAFVVHPIGRTVWFFSLFWLIPIVSYFFRERSLIVRSLGATFTAHAVGGALWIYFIPLPEAVWVSLIPVVIIERLTFAGGIAATYLIFNNVFNFLNEKNLVSYQFPVNQKYVWGLNQSPLFNR